MSNTILNRVPGFNAVAKAAVVSAALLGSVALNSSFDTTAHAGENKQEIASNNVKKVSTLSVASQAAVFSESQRAVSVYVQLSPRDIGKKERIDNIISARYAGKADHKTFYATGPDHQEKTIVIIFIGGVSYDHNGDGESRHVLGGELLRAMDASAQYYNRVKNPRVSSVRDNNSSDLTAEVN